MEATSLPRPLKWSRDLHPIRERAQRSKTETWSRQDLENLFNVGRATAQTLMKAIGDVQSVGAAHFIDRASLLAFLDEMIAAESVDEAMRKRLLEAEAPPAPKSLRVPIPTGLRNVMLRELPDNIKISPGHLEITALTAVGMLESLVLLAQAMKNDLDQVKALVEPPKSSDAPSSAELQSFFRSVREMS